MLVAPREEVARVLSLTGLDQIIPVVASVAEAAAGWADGEDSPSREHD